MKTDETKTGPKGSKGGPRTKAGKEKTRLNALKHGLYSTLSDSRTKDQRQRFRLHRKISAKLVAQIGSVDVIEEQWIDAAADALVRKATVLRYEEACIEKALEKPLRVLRDLEDEIAHQNQCADDLRSELARLEEEKQTGLRWEEPGRIRIVFLAGVVREKAGVEFAETFLRMSLPEERKACFNKVVQYDQTILLNHLIGMMTRTMESHALRAQELATELDRGRKNLACAQERAALLSKEDMEFILDSINKCNRQFSRAIDSLTRYREAKANRDAKKGSGEARLERPQD
ncbi:MAG: hypothetical protein Q8P51_03080 [Ignavibacteria bacterium]|nr:hypothetical protein [Ignavibacteria bacterium]